MVGWSPGGLMNIRISVMQGPVLSKEMRRELLKTVQLLWGPKEKEKPMKYFEVTATTPYCGEELTGYYMAESEEELVASGKVDDLIADCVSEFMDRSDYEEYGFDSEEEWEEYYFEGAGYEAREISFEEYKAAKERGW